MQVIYLRYSQRQSRISNPANVDATRSSGATISTNNKLILLEKQIIKHDYGTQNVYAFS